MSDSDEPDEGKRLSDVEAIAEALRAGVLDTNNRFRENRGERPDEPKNNSDACTPDDILADLRSADDTESSETANGNVVVAELTVRIERNETDSPVRKNHLKEALTPDVPPDSIQIREIKSVTPTLNALQVQMVVALEVEIVEDMLSRDLSKTSADTQVKILT